MTVRFADTQDFSNIGHRPLSPQLSIPVIEDKVRNSIAARRARTDDYLKDFDRLRTGFVTKAQFDRCLDQHYGIVLKPKEDAQLMKKYGSDPRHPGMVNYRAFCKTIDSAFSPDMSNQSMPHKPPSPPVTQQALNFPALEKCRQLLEHIAPYCKYHGINIKSCYEDFDQHNIGLVTESQFFRRFPGPPDVTSEEQALLAKKYIHPSKQGLCNYLDFHQDVEQILTAQDNNNYLIDRNMEENKPCGRKSRQGTTLQDVFEKIRIAVHKNGIRTTEFFKDHDKLRSGVITRNQFVCGLSLCCGTQANLSRDEIDMLVEYYQTEDGRVRYKEFCHLMENAFNVPDLEKKPTVDVFRPPIGALAKTPNNLSAADEERVAQILNELHETVRKKRLMLYPYFKDFDRGFGYTRGITNTQFSRLLHMVGLNLTKSDLELICRKFEYQVGGDINYPAFIQAIDPEYIGRAPVKGDWNTTQYICHDEKVDDTPDISSVDVDGLINRIRNDVLVNRIRVEEFFQDFDPLRHGSISVSRFRMGLSAMGQDHLSEAQILAIINRYADPKTQFHVLWTKFLTDIEEVFTRRGLEKSPLAVLPPAEVFRMPKPGTCDWSKASLENQQKVEEAMHKMRQKTNQRRILTKPCFQDFDRHNIGYVTKSQLRQCMAYLCFDCQLDEIDLVYEKFSDDTGFNYLKFLEELQPSEKQEHKYLKRLEELKLVHKNKAVTANREGLRDIESIMYKIKTKVVRAGIRVYEFMKDYDKLRTGRMLKTSFPRALDMCTLGLTVEEMKIVEYWYASADHPGYIDFYRFCEDVESSFTQKGLEKNPTVVPTQFKPNSKGNCIELLPEAEDLLETVMHRLADRVRIRRIQLFPLFEDYDRLHNGTVSRSQLHRVLSELELGCMVSAREFHVLYEKFDSVIGGKHDFDYIQFCDILNNYAHFDPHVP